MHLAPGSQNIPIWLTLLVGIVAALIGTAIAAAVGLSAERWNWLV